MVSAAARKELPREIDSPFGQDKMVWIFGWLDG